MVLPTIKTGTSSDPPEIAADAPLPPSGQQGSRAVLSPCRLYRYALWRRWADGPQVLWVMLNPSTADETEDDPTIRRCIAFSESWGFGALAVANLFALRSTDPKALYHCGDDPIGTENDAWLGRLATESSLIVAAWGNHGSCCDRDIVVRALLDNPRGTLKVLRLTAQGQPSHPLYLPTGLDPIPWASDTVGSPPPAGQLFAEPDLRDRDPAEFDPSISPSPDIRRSRDPADRARVTAHGDHLRATGRALPLCWLPENF